MLLTDVVLLRQFLDTYLDVLLEAQVPSRRRPIMLRSGETLDSVMVVLFQNLGITAHWDPCGGLRLVAASGRCFPLLLELAPCMRAGGTFSDVGSSQHGQAGTAVEEFGFGGSRPTPSLPEARTFARALLAMIAAEKALKKAGDRIPSDTGQWDGHDYTDAAQEDWNRAADQLFAQASGMQVPGLEGPA